MRMKSGTTPWSAAAAWSSWMWMETTPAKCPVRLTSAMNTPRWKSPWRLLVAMVRTHKNYWEYVQNMRITTGFSPYNFLLENFSCEWLNMAVFVLEEGKITVADCLLWRFLLREKPKLECWGNCSLKSMCFHSAVYFSYVMSHSGINCSDFCLWNRVFEFLWSYVAVPKWHYFGKREGFFFFSAWAFPFLNSLKSSAL